MLKKFNEEFDRLIEWDAAKYKNLNGCSTHFMIPGKGAWKMCWPIYTSPWVFHFAASLSTSTAHLMAKQKRIFNCSCNITTSIGALIVQKQQSCMLEREVPLQNKVGIKKPEMCLTYFNTWDQILGEKLQI